MAEHTRGRLRPIRAFTPDNTGGFDIAIVDDEGEIVGETYEHVGYEKNREFKKRPAAANARRLVACWNALLEYTTEEIETFGPERSPQKETPPCKPT